MLLIAREIGMSLDFRVGQKGTFAIQSRLPTDRVTLLTC